jgi:hypothetical protein
MANQVFANGREIACKADQGKVIAAFPDVCLSPPTPPAGPVPIPYPVTSMSSDTEQGTKQVKISGKEVMQKDSSDFKKCTGDEACTKSLGMGVVTHQQTGKVYFAAWSMDVKIEGANAVRHLDMTTSNHASKPGQTPPWPFQKSMSTKGKADPCKKEKNKVEKECKGKKKTKDRCPPHTPPPRPNVGKLPKGKAAMAAFLGTANGKKWKVWRSETKAYYNKRAKGNAKDACLRALRCKLVPWKGGGKDGKCCPGQTPHHLIEQNSFDGITPYNPKKAPCVCAEGTSWHEGSHGMVHTIQGNLNNKATKNGQISLKKARKNGATALKKVFPESGCSQKCIEAQLKNGHKPLRDDKQIKSSPSGYTSDPAAASVLKRVAAKLKQLAGRMAGGSAS